MTYRDTSADTTLETVYEDTLSKEELIKHLKEQNEILFQELVKLKAEQVNYWSKEED